MEAENCIFSITVLIWCIILKYNLILIYKVIIFHENEHREGLHPWLSENTCFHRGLVQKQGTEEKHQDKNRAKKNTKDQMMFDLTSDIVWNRWGTVKQNKEKLDSCSLQQGYSTGSSQVRCDFCPQPQKNSIFLM